MAKTTKDKYARQHNPIVVLICEGRNQTETKYFNHFNKRENPFNLKIYSSEATDPKNMAKKARSLIEQWQLDSQLGDRVFCLIDLDLSQTQYKKVLEEKNKARNKKCEVEFIISNPCFEIWLLYYFVNYPKIESSSQKVKEQLKKHVPLYSESFDIVKECKLEQQHAKAINRAEKAHSNQDSDTKLLDRNPYTEIPTLLDILINWQK